MPRKFPSPPPIKRCALVDASHVAAVDASADISLRTILQAEADQFLDWIDSMKLRVNATLTQQQLEVERLREAARREERRATYWNEVYLENFDELGVLLKKAGHGRRLVDGGRVLAPGMRDLVAEARQQRTLRGTSYDPRSSDAVDDSSDIGDKRSDTDVGTARGDKFYGERRSFGAFSGEARYTEPSDANRRPSGDTAQDLARNDANDDDVVDVLSGSSGVGNGLENLKYSDYDELVLEDGDGDGDCDDDGNKDDVEEFNGETSDDDAQPGVSDDENLNVLEMVDIYDYEPIEAGPADTRANFSSADAPRSQMHISGSLRPRLADARYPYNHRNDNIERAETDQFDDNYHLRVPQQEDEAEQDDSGVYSHEGERRTSRSENERSFFELQLRQQVSETLQRPAALDLAQEVQSVHDLDDLGNLEQDKTDEVDEVEEKEEALPEVLLLRRESPPERFMDDTFVSTLAEDANFFASLAQGALDAQIISANNSSAAVSDAVLRTARHSDDGAFNADLVGMRDQEEEDEKDVQKIGLAADLETTDDDIVNHVAPDDDKSHSRGMELPVSTQRSEEPPTDSSPHRDITGAFSATSTRLPMLATTKTVSDATSHLDTPAFVPPTFQSLHSEDPVKTLRKLKKTERKFNIKLSAVTQLQQVLGTDVHCELSDDSLYLSSDYEFQDARDSENVRLWFTQRLDPLFRVRLGAGAVRTGALQILHESASAAPTARAKPTKPDLTDPASSADESEHDSDATLHMECVVGEPQTTQDTLTQEAMSEEILTDTEDAPAYWLSPLYRIVAPVLDAPESAESENEMNVDERAPTELVCENIVNTALNKRHSDNSGSTAAEFAENEPHAISGISTEHSNEDSIWHIDVQSATESKNSGALQRVFVDEPTESEPNLVIYDDFTEIDQYSPVEPELIEMMEPVGEAAAVSARTDTDLIEAVDVSAGGAVLVPTTISEPDDEEAPLVTETNEEGLDVIVSTSVEEVVTRETSPVLVFVASEVGEVGDVSGSGGVLEPKSPGAFSEAAREFHAPLESVETETPTERVNDAENVDLPVQHRGVSPAEGDSRKRPADDRGSFGPLKKLKLVLFPFNRFFETGHSSELSELDSVLGDEIGDIISDDLSDATAQSISESGDNLSDAERQVLPGVERGGKDKNFEMVLAETVLPEPVLTVLETVLVNTDVMGVARVETDPKTLNEEEDPTGPVNSRIAQKAWFDVEGSARLGMDLEGEETVEKHRGLEEVGAYSGCGGPLERKLEVGGVAEWVEVNEVSGEVSRGAPEVPQEDTGTGGSVKQHFEASEDLKRKLSRLPEALEAPEQDHEVPEEERENEDRFKLGISSPAEFSALKTESSAVHNDLSSAQLSTEKELFAAEFSLFETDLAEPHREYPETELGFGPFDGSKHFAGSELQVPEELPKETTLEHPEELRRKTDAAETDVVETEVVGADVVGAGVAEAVETAAQTSSSPVLVSVLSGAGQDEEDESPGISWSGPFLEMQSAGLGAEVADDVGHVKAAPSVSIRQDKAGEGDKNVFEENCAAPEQSLLDFLNENGSNDTTNAANVETEEVALLPALSRSSSPLSSEPTPRLASSVFEFLRKTWRRVSSSPRLLSEANDNEPGSLPLVPGIEPGSEPGEAGDFEVVAEVFEPVLFADEVSEPVPFAEVEVAEGPVNEGEILLVVAQLESLPSKTELAAPGNMENETVLKEDNELGETSGAEHEGKMVSRALSVHPDTQKTDAENIAEIVAENDAETAESLFSTVSAVSEEVETKPDIRPTSPPSAHTRSRRRSSNELRTAEKEHLNERGKEDDEEKDEGEEEERRSDDDGKEADSKPDSRSLKTEAPATPPRPKRRLLSLAGESIAQRVHRETEALLLANAEKLKLSAHSPESAPAGPAPPKAHGSPRKNHPVTPVGPLSVPSGRITRSMKDHDKLKPQSSPIEVYAESAEPVVHRERRVSLESHPALRTRSKSPIKQTIQELSSPIDEEPLKKKRVTRSVKKKLEELSGCPDDAGPEDRGRSRHR